MLWHDLWLQSEFLVEEHKMDLFHTIKIDYFSELMSVVHHARFKFTFNCAACRWMNAMDCIVWYAEVT
jgi:hypothetical protein